MNPAAILLGRLHRLTPLFGAAAILALLAAPAQAQWVPEPGAPVCVSVPGIPCPDERTEPEPPPEPAPRPYPTPQPTPAPVPVVPQLSAADQARALNEAGLALFARGEIDAAIAKFEDAKRISPYNETIRRNLADARARREELAGDATLADDRIGALLRYRKALSFLPTGGVATNLLRKIREIETARFTPIKHMLVGGTTWSGEIYNLTPEENRNREEYKARLLQSGLDYRDYFATMDYDAIVGVAYSSKVIYDLPFRVLLDNISLGRMSAEFYSGYNALKGYQATELDCHSNGAMICLAALAKGDAMARKVRLFGPQITANAMQEWRKLLELRKIESLEIVVQDGDPVPYVSNLGGLLVEKPVEAAGKLRDWISNGLGLADVAPAGWQPRPVPLLDKGWNEMRPAPAITITRVGCPYILQDRLTLKCHSFATYVEGLHEREYLENLRARAAAAQAQPEQ